MIEKLDIKGFLTFEELSIPSLKRVNLIAGKNNAGKTALLEAIRVFNSNGDNTVINNILHSRGAYTKGWDESYKALFNRKHGDLYDRLSINNMELKYYVRENKFRIFLSHLGKKLTPNFSLESDVIADNPKDKSLFVPFHSDYKHLSTLGETISLTPKEQDVLKILQESIDANIIRFNIGVSGVKILLNGIKEPVPLASLGDGVHRILLIALSLANAQDKYLLIDEIELGLHYSVLETLWEMIFKYALEWNIQVFVTTHSQDAIRAFHYVASQEKYINDAEFIRLQQGRTGGHEAIIYDGERLKDSIALDLEIR